MFKLLVTASKFFGAGGCSVHQVVIDYERQYDADIAYEKLQAANRDVIKLY